MQTQSVLVSFLCLSLCQALAPISKNTRVGQIEMSPIGCGTWAWGNRFLWGYSKEEDREIQQAFEYVVKNGVNWFDTADSYGTGTLSGRAEELLGIFENSLTPKKKINFCTKLAPYPWRIGKISMKIACKESIERLQRPLDVLQLHWPPSLRWQEEAYLNAFDELVSEKKSLQLGVSNYGPKNLQRIVKRMGDKQNKIKSNQVELILLHFVRYTYCCWLS